MDCRSCGARLMRGEKQCPYCGTHVDDERAPAEPSGFESRIPVDGTELRELLHYIPSSLPARSGQIVMIIFGLVFASFAAFFIFMATRMGAPLLFRLFPVIFLIVGIAIIMGGISGLAKLTSSPLERQPSVVVGKRQHFDSDSKGSGSTTYHITFQTEDGNRKEHRVPGRLYGQLEKGDSGVAYLKGGFLLDFRRLPRPGSSG